MKKFFVILFVALFGLSLSVSAQNYAWKSLCIIDSLSQLPSNKAFSGNITASVVGTPTATQAIISFAWTITGGVTFIHAGDSVSIFFEIKDSTTNTILGSQYVVHITTTGDSVNTGVIKTLTGLTSGHMYKVKPHLLLYQQGNPVWFANGNALIFSTTCVTPNITVTSADTICAGTSKILTASGAFNYTWSPAGSLNISTGPNVIATPTSTTTYTVIGNNGSGCTASATVKITVAGAMSLTVSGTDTICSGSSKQLSANGTATSYIWSPATGLSNPSIANPMATPSSTTTYTVTATNNTGCTGTASVTITIVPGFTLSVSQTDTTCGMPVQVTATGGNTYVWSPASSLDDPNISNPIATPTVTTIYTVNSSNGACSQTATVKIVVATPIVSSVSYNNGTLVIVGSFPGNISSISINGVIYVPFIGNSTQAIFNNVVLSNGDLILIQTISSDCFTYWLFSTAGVEENSNQSCIKEGEQIDLFDITGRKISSVNSPKNYLEKEIFQVKNLFKNLSSGCYLVRSKEVTQKIIIN